MKFNTFFFKSNLNKALKKKYKSRKESSKSKFIAIETIENNVKSIFAFKKSIKTMIAAVSLRVLALARREPRLAAAPSAGC